MQLLAYMPLRRKLLLAIIFIFIWRKHEAGFAIVTNTFVPGTFI